MDSDDKNKRIDKKVSSYLILKNFLIVTIILLILGIIVILVFFHIIPGI